MRLSPLLLIAGWLFACDGSSSTGVEASALQGEAGVAGQAGAPACEAASGQVCVRQVRGVVEDGQGMALPDTVVTVCGAGCFVGVTGPQGAFSVALDAPLAPEEYVLSAHGRPTHASTYLRLPPLAPEVVFTAPVELPPLPSLGPVLPEDGGAAAALLSGPLTLLVQEGTVVDLDIDDLERGEAGRMVRVAPVDPARATFVEGATVVLALAPFGAKLSKPAGVEVDTPTLAEGQEVEFILMEDDLLADAGNLAGLPRVAATGRVEGGKARSAAGQGVDRLTWLAVRPR